MHGYVVVCGHRALGMPNSCQELGAPLRRAAEASAFVSEEGKFGGGSSARTP